MKILCVSDEEINDLWAGWNENTKKKLSDVSLIISAGDLSAGYLEFLVTMLNVPLLYVRGNHDISYSEKAPEGCTDIDGEMILVEVSPDGSARIIDGGGSFIGKVLSLFRLGKAPSKGTKVLRIAGLGGSMQYRSGKNMYTEKEMSKRVSKLMKKVMLMQPAAKEAMQCRVGNPALMGKRKVDILVTHAPARGYGDMDDLPHRGFSCFSRFLEETHSGYHLYGHVHMSYGRFERTMKHPSGTELINVSGMYILEI